MGQVLYPPLSRLSICSLLAFLCFRTRDARGVYCLQTGLWWRFDLSPAHREAFRDDSIELLCSLSINLLELFAMMITAWSFVEALVRCTLEKGSSCEGTTLRRVLGSVNVGGVGSRAQVP